MFVKFGVLLPYPESVAGRSPDDLVTIARAIETAGLHGCGVADHPFPRLSVAHPNVHHTLDPFVVLGFLAAATRSLRLITMANVLPYRHPMITAKAAATLDHLSGGRFVHGVAVGYHEAEFDALGADFSRRATRAEDAIAAITTAWRGEEVYGTVWEMPSTGNSMRPMPTTRPHPPIWMAGNSRASRERAVRLCQGWAPFESGAALASRTRTAPVSPTNLHRQIAHIKQLRDERGRADPFDISLLRTFFDWDAAPIAIDRDLRALRDAGVTWLVAGVPNGRSVGEVVAAIERVAPILLEI